MKTNSQVISSWVAGYALSGRNIFTDGYTIYSYGYHFPIARKLANGKIMLNTSYFSNTTARHQCYVRSAIINNGWCDRTIPCYSMDSEENTHVIKHSIINTIEGIPNCRKIEKYTTIIRDEIGMLKKFKDAIGESCPKWVGDILFVVNNLKGKSLKTWAKNYKLA